MTSAHPLGEGGVDTVLGGIRGGRQAGWRARNQGMLLGRGGGQAGCHFGCTGSITIYKAFVDLAWMHNVRVVNVAKAEQQAAAHC